MTHRGASEGNSEERKIRRQIMRDKRHKNLLKEFELVGNLILVVQYIIHSTNKNDWEKTSLDSVLKRSLMN